MEAVHGLTALTVDWQEYTVLDRFGVARPPYAHGSGGHFVTVLVPPWLGDLYNTGRARGPIGVTHASAMRFLIWVCDHKNLAQLEALWRLNGQEGNQYASAIYQEWEAWVSHGERLGIK